jgi:hypothetical protein
MKLWSKRENRMNSFILSIVGGVISIGIGWFDKNFLSGTQGKDDNKMTISLALRYFLMGFGVSYIVLLGSSYMMGEGEVQGDSSMVGDMEDITDSLLENTRETFSVGRPRF